MRTKPVSKRLTDHMGRVQVTAQIRTEVLDLVQRCQQESKFQGSQAQFIETLLRLGANAWRDGAPQALAER